MVDAVFIAFPTFPIPAEASPPTLNLEGNSLPVTDLGSFQVAVEFKQWDGIKGSQKL